MIKGAHKQQPRAGITLLRLEARKSGKTVPSVRHVTEASSHLWRQKIKMISVLTGDMAVSAASPPEAVVRALSTGVRSPQGRGHRCPPDDNVAGHWAGSVPDTLFSLSRESQLLKLCPQLCPAYSVWPRQLPFINWLVRRSCCPQTCPTVVQSQGPPQGQPALWCLYVACASVRESQAVFASIPASVETVTCVGRVTTGRDRPPQSRVVPDLQFSCPGSQGRADQISKPPQGTAHCTAPHGLLQLLLLGASHSQ